MRIGAKRTRSAPAKGMYGLLAIAVALLAFLAVSTKPSEAAPPPTTMNFQGRLADSSGNLMPDGLYNMQFRLFTVSSGGSAVWTETRENNGTDYRVQVTNGLFSTQLGEANALSASLFNATNLYFEITMATPATATCSTASCATWESPMTPRQKLATSAYAFNAASLNGFTEADFAAASGSANYIQNTGTPQTADFNITGTGTANLLQASTFDRATSGTLTIGGTNATSISLADDVVVAGTNTLRLTGDTWTNIDGYGTPAEGQITYDTDNKQLLVYANGKWQADRTDAILVAASNSSQADKNAADYVADGNTGAANDGDQIQINAALTAASGKKVVLLAGTYVADATILVPNNTTLAGVGNGTVIELADIDTTDNLIENSDTLNGTGVVIRDIKIDGRNDLNTGSIEQYGIYLDGMGAGSGASARQGGVVENIVADRFADEGIFLDSSSNNQIINNKIQNNGGIGVGISLYEGSSNNVVKGNITQGHLYGILLSTVAQDNDNNLIADNIVQDNTVSGIHIAWGGDGNDVTGNSVTGSDTGIELVQVSNNNVSSNTISDSGGTTGNDGILLDAADYNQIISNTITDTECNTSCYAINISNSTSDNNYLSSNVFSDTDLDDDATINDAGTGTIYAVQAMTAGGLDVRFRQADSVSAFAIQNAGGISLLQVDTANGRSILNAGSTSSSGELQIRSDNNAILLLEADLDDDASEVGSPYIKFTQDGPASSTAINSVIGMIQGSNIAPDGTTVTGASGNNLLIANTSSTNFGVQLATSGAVRLDVKNSGDVDVATGDLQVSGTTRIDSTGRLYAVSGGGSTAPTMTFSGDTNTGFYRISDGQIRVTANGNLVGCFDPQDGGQLYLGGCDPGGVTSLYVNEASGRASIFNRGNDGSVVGFSGGGNLEGDISISGTTVSYNAFTGSHYGKIDEGSLKRGELASLTGDNFYKPGGQEPVYGIKKSETANDPNILGAYLALNSSSDPFDLTENPHLVMAAGNGDVWLADNGSGNVRIGDPLISSGDVPGYAMRDNKQFAVSHVFAKAAENIDWSKVTDTKNGVKVKKVSVLFSYYNQENISKTFNPQHLAVASNGVFGGNLSVGASLNVSGEAILQDLTVRGDAVFEGRLLVVGDLVVPNLIVKGKLITAGDTPTIQVGTAAGEVDIANEIAAPVATVDGNDTSGTIRFTTGANTAAGELVSIDFSSAYSATPRVVFSPASGSSSKAEVYFDPDTATAEGFALRTDTALEPGQEYVFNYWIVE